MYSVCFASSPVDVGWGEENKTELNFLAVYQIFTNKKWRVVPFLDLTLFYNEYSKKILSWVFCVQSNWLKKMFLFSTL